MAAEHLHRAYDTLTEEGARLAGTLPQLAQRASVYHHLFRASGGNHVFPLIAAHGALWAGGYFRFGMRLGRALVWQHCFDAEKRARLLGELETFADAFREVNRQVCVDTYRNFYFTAQFGDHPDAAEFIRPTILEALNRLHAARERGETYDEGEKHELFRTHFLNEQETVVGPRISAAVARFEWPLLKGIALRPIIRFAYFPRATVLCFRNFALTEERIRNGERAFAIGSQMGWNVVEQALRRYAVLPEMALEEPGRYFATLRRQVLQAV
jgi:hypothetical protein